MGSAFYMLALGRLVECLPPVRDFSFLNSHFNLSFYCSAACMSIFEEIALIDIERNCCDGFFFMYGLFRIFHQYHRADG